MVFVSSSLQHTALRASVLAAAGHRGPANGPISSVAMAGRVAKRPRPKIKPVLQPQTQPTPVPTPGRRIPMDGHVGAGPVPMELDPPSPSAVLAPYISAHGLGPMMAHSHLAPGLIQTQHSLDLGEATDQHESGRCWIFASLNWLRQHVQKTYGKQFQYSQNYVAYWDKVERANTHFNRMMAGAETAPDSRSMEALNELFTDGGTWEFFYNVVRKHGVVPDYAMPETRMASQSHRYMRKLQRRVREIGGILRDRACTGATREQLETIKAQGMAEVRQMLNLCLGVPPEKFLWRDPSDPKAPWVEKTPQAFLADNPAKLDDMVYLCSYPQYPMRSHLMFDEVTNVDGAPVSQALNVPMPVIKQAIRRSVKAGEAVVSYSDILSLDDKHDLWSLHADQSAALLGVDVGLHLTKDRQVQYHVSGANHAMMFSGCDNAKPRKYQGAPLTAAEAELVEPLWQVENSWGGKPMYMTDRWVDAYVFGIVVNKKHLSKQALGWLEDDKLPTEHLPPWSPMRPMSD